MILTLEGRHQSLTRLDQIERKALLEIEALDDQIDQLRDGPMYGALDVDLAALRGQRRKVWQRVQFTQACVVITARGAH